VVVLSGFGRRSRAGVFGTGVFGVRVNGLTAWSRYRWGVSCREVKSEPMERVWRSRAYDRDMKAVRLFVSCLECVYCAERWVLPGTELACRNCGGKLWTQEMGSMELGGAIFPVSEEVVEDEHTGMGAPVMGGEVSEMRRDRPGGNHRRAGDAV